MAGAEGTAHDEQLQALRAELAEQEGLCRAGLAAGVVIHEFSNLLNAILLHTAVVQQKAGEPLCAELNNIRDQGRVAAGLMRQLQHYRRECRPEPYPVDLNQVVRTVAVMPAAGPAITLDLAPELPKVPGTFTDLKLLAELLVSNALAITPSGGTVRVHTSHAADTVRLLVADGGPALSPELLSHVFDAHTSTREGINPLDMAACQSLARRLQASIHADGRPDGVTMVVEFMIG